MKQQSENSGTRKAVSEEEVYTASATIREIELMEGKSTSDSEVFVPISLKLEILPAVGESYITEVKWKVESNFLKTINPGRLLKVKVNVKDATIIYPYGNWAFRLSST